MEYPDFDEAGQLALEPAPIAKLYWMAIAQLSTQGDFAHMTPQEVHAHVVKTTKDVTEQNARIEADAQGGGDAPPVA